MSDEPDPPHLAMPDADMEARHRGGGWRNRNGGGGDRRHGWRHGSQEEHDSMHGRMDDRMRGPDGPGADFVFRRGRGDGAIIIQCAEDDSTKECADAILPLLQLMLPEFRAEAPTGTPRP